MLTSYLMVLITVDDFFVNSEPPCSQSDEEKPST